MPRLSAASTSPCRSVNAASARRADSDVAVIVPPRMIPPTGTIEIPCAGTTPVSKHKGTTIPIPTARGRTSQIPDLPDSERRLDVNAAAPNITSSTSSDDHRCASAAARISEIAAS